MFAEFLAGAGMDNTVFTPGSIVEGTVSAVKGDDVFVDIGYKSEGIVGLDEFAAPGGESVYHALARFRLYSLAPVGSVDNVVGL